MLFFENRQEQTGKQISDTSNCVQSYFIYPSSTQVNVYFLYILISEQLAKARYTFDFQRSFENVLQYICSVNIRKSIKGQ